MNQRSIWQIGSLAVLLSLAQGSVGLNNGVYTITSKYSGKLVEVGSADTSNEANIMQWPANGLAHQRWTITNVGGNDYSVINVHSGKAMEVNGFSTEDGGNVAQYEYWGGASQTWTITQQSNGYYTFINKHSGKSLDLLSWDTSDGANIGQWEAWGGDTQLWALDLVSGTPPSPPPLDGYPLGNAPVNSAGCGSSPGLSSGTHYMTSAGLNREYIVSVPANYDQNKPYRLVFGMHWMGGSAEAVQGWSQWFGLKPLDTAGTTIFVAPQGYTNGMPWRGGDNRDHVFFEELHQHLSSNLCIDQSRVFSVGFSFGAMFTNSLAQNHQDTLRGVVVYATADYNIYFPPNTGKPLAYMGVHGLFDPTCPISSGRNSRDRFVANNQCAVPGSVPEARSGGSHVTYDFSCPSNYPVRWSTFSGAHTYPPNNSGTWVHGETWAFITQF